MLGKSSNLKILRFDASVFVGVHCMSAQLVHVKVCMYVRIYGCAHVRVHLNLTGFCTFSVISLQLIGLDGSDSVSINTLM